MKLGRQNSTPRTQTPTISAVLSLLKYIMAGAGLRVLRGICRACELGASFGRTPGTVAFRKAWCLEPNRDWSHARSTWIGGSRDWTTQPSFGGGRAWRGRWLEP